MTRAHRTVRLFAAAAFFSLAVPLAHAATTINGGTLGGFTHWTSGGSPYLVKGDITIPQGAILAIDPDVVVSMAAGDTQGGGDDPSRIEIRIAGTLSAGDNVTFRGDQEQKRYWYGIVVLPGATPLGLGAGINIQHADIGMRIDSATAARTLYDLNFKLIYDAGLDFAAGHPDVIKATFDQVNTGIRVRDAATQASFQDIKTTGGTYGIRILSGTDHAIRRLDARGNSWGLWLESGSAKVSNTLIADNQTGVYVRDSTAEFTNVTIANSSGEGLLVVDATAQVRNSILTNNHPNLFATAQSLTITYSTVWGGYDIEGYATYLDGMLTSYPEYVDGYHIAPTSPAANAGSASFELDGIDLDRLPRRLGGNPVDQGAYESAKVADQSIAFTVTDHLATEAPFDLVATATSELPVTLTSSTPLVCTVSDVTLTLIGRNGTCTIVASQPGNEGFTPAAPVTRSFQVTGALAVLQLPVNMYDFGPRPLSGDPSTTSITITNTGYADAPVVGVVVSGPHAADFFVTYSCAAVVALSECQFNVAFSPAGLGTRTATATFTFGDLSNTVLTLSLKGTALPNDSTPDAFFFTSQGNVTPGAVITSNAVTVTGTTVPAAIAITGGSYSIGCGSSYTTNAAMVAANQTVCVRHTAPLALSALTTTTLVIGGVSSNFTSTTIVTLPPEGDFDGDGIPNGVEPLESRNVFVKDNDVFGNPRLFAMQQYRDFLGREGDAGGIQFYIDLLNAGTLARANVIENFFNSPEFSGVASPIARLYFATFLRTPDYDGLLFQISIFRSGASLAAIANNFTLSGEFQARYGTLTDPQYVTLLYQNILGRTPVQAEVDFHVNRLNTGTSRGEVLVGFSESPEYQGAIGNEVYVTMMYVGMLRRAPEPAGLTFWVTYMDGGNSGLALILGFLNAPEYRNRFLP